MNPGGKNRKHIKSKLADQNKEIAHDILANSQLTNGENLKSVDGLQIFPTQANSRYWVIERKRDFLSVRLNEW